MKKSIRIATIELMPYPPQGEFVIVGILAVSEHGQLVRKIVGNQDTERFCQFFPEIGEEVFRSALQHLGEMIADMEASPFENGKALYRALTVPREGMIRIKPAGAAMAENLDTWIEAAFARYVHRKENVVPS